MAISIVGHDDSIKRRISCYHCGAILEYLPVDINQTSTRDYDGGSDTTYFIECPNCRTKIYVTKYRPPKVEQE